MLPKMMSTANPSMSLLAFMASSLTAFPRRIPVLFVDHLDSLFQLSHGEILPPLSVIWWDVVREAMTAPMRLISCS